MGQKINIDPENAYFVTDQKLALHEKRLRNQKQHAHSGRKINLETVVVAVAARTHAVLNLY